jgi:hypothetical protein
MSTSSRSRLGRKVKGCLVQPDPNRDLVLETLTQLINNPKALLEALPGLWVESQDAQLASKRFKTMLGVRGTRYMKPPSEALMILE